MTIDYDKIPVPDPAPDDFPALHNIDYFRERLKSAFERISGMRSYNMESLGQVHGHDLILISPADMDGANKSCILSAAGFHGEEAAGPWGIVRYLETATPEQMNAINHSFLPLVNPTGFITAQRFNIDGENPNRGFIAIPPEVEVNVSGNNKFPSREGQILVRHLTTLLTLGRDGFVSQHEDWRMEEAFTYINERAEMPSPFALAIRDALAKYFNLVADDHPYFEGASIQDSICHNDLDGSFESLMMFYGVPLIATPETPGQGKATDRIEANREVAAAFADFMAKQNCNP